MKVSVGASSFSQTGEAMEILKKRGIDVVTNPYGRKMTEDEIIDHLNNADGLLAGLEPLNGNVFDKCPDLKALARIGAGMDNVDVDAALEHGIKVSNTPDAPTDAVAEMALAALLTLLHRIVPSNEDMHNNIWKKHMGRSIRGCKVLIVGYGRIGRKFEEHLRMLGADVMIYDKFVPDANTCSFEDGITKADVISLHVSGIETIITERELNLMKNGVIILNSARGSLIDETALYNALRNGKVSWFWGDAFWEEPYSGMLCSLPNAVLTPHICTYTDRCRQDMEKQAVLNLLRDLGVE